MSDLLAHTEPGKALTRASKSPERASSLSVPAGSVVGFVGCNGAGKTTTIKATLGLVRPYGGSIALFGEEVTGAPCKRLAELKQRIGVVFDTCSFPEALSVDTVGKLMAQCYQVLEPRRRSARSPRRCSCPWTRR